MRFSTIFSVLASGAVALAGVVAPAALVARGNEKGLDIVAKLKLDVDVCIGKIDGCKDIGCHKQVYDEIESAFQTACDGFDGFKDKTDADYATPLAAIFLEIGGKVKSYADGCDKEFAEEVVKVYAGLDDKFCVLLKLIAVFIVDIFVKVGDCLKGSVDIFVYLKLDVFIGLCIDIKIKLGL